MVVSFRTITSVALVQLETRDSTKPDYPAVSAAARTWEGMPNIERDRETPVKYPVMLP